MDSNESEIIKAAIAGDSDAFESIIKSHSRLLYAHAYSILRQPQDAEDVVQESLLKAFKSRWKVRDPDKFPQWLVSIVRNRALDIVKRRKTVLLSEDHEVEDQNTERPSKQMEGSEFKKKIHLVLSTLPEHHRLAVTLRYLEGMDHQGIQEVMGLSDGALRGILGRAMQTLRISLKPLAEEIS